MKNLQLKKVIFTLTLVYLSVLPSVAQSPTFEEAPAQPFEGEAESAVAHADVDGDTDLDILIIGQNNAFAKTAKLYLNDGAGNFTEVMGTPFEGVSRGAVAFADIDGDNDQDVMILGENSSNQPVTNLYTNNGSGSFTLVMGTPFEGLRFGDIAFGNIDGDSDTDVIITGVNNNGLGDRRAKLYTNDGSGIFTEVLGTPFEGVINSTVDLVDVNGDSDLDVLITGSAGTFPNFTVEAKLYTNNGSGVFTEDVTTPFVGINSGSAVFGDIDNDNDQDVVISGVDLMNQSVPQVLFENDGNGNFTEKTTTLTGMRWGDSIFSDVDNDGDLDFLATGWQGSTIVTLLYLNDGSGNFTQETGLPFEGTSNGGLFADDVNGDGDIDVFLVGTNPSGTRIAKLYAQNSLPVFVSGSFINFLENGAGTVLDIDANDGDGGNSDDNVTYQISGGSDMNVFNLDANAGILTFQNTPDFENPTDSDTDNDYLIEITADDGTLTNTQFITISVTNQSEAPIFETADVISVSENLISIIDIDANDGDGGSSDVGITYSLTDGTDQAAFDVDANNGELTFNFSPDFENPLDADMNNSYHVEVTASDGSNTTAQLITVTVDNVMEPPIFESLSTASFSENSTGTVIDVNANNADGGTTDASISYLLLGGVDDAIFTIDSNTGLITFKVSPDFENPTDSDGDNNYEVRVRADDGSEVTNQDITITVGNVEEQPVFESNSSANFEENGTGSVIDVNANDGDGGATDMSILFSLSGGTDQGDFSLDVFGVLTFITPPDFETPHDANGDNIYEVEVTANDGFTATVQSIVITVTDVNENSVPQIADQQFNINENSPNGTIVGVLVASDPDGDVLTFSSTIDNNDPFSLSSDGELTVSDVSLLDFESVAMWGFSVEVDDGNGATATAALTINVVDVNESTNQSPTISDQTFSIDENSPNGTVIGTIVASDPDGDILTFSSTIDNNDPFSLSSDGELTVSDVSLLDFESVAMWGFSVEVDDGNGATATAALTINVVDVNESTNQSPTISDQTFNIEENSPNGTVIGTIVASDPDGDMLTFSSTIDNNDPFSISSDGELTVSDVSLLDFESVAMWGFSVEVDDGNGATATAALTINVVDVNESTNQSPTISDQTFNIEENSPNGTVIGTIVASDPDGDMLTYSSTMDSNDPFSLSSDGELTVSDVSLLDFESVAMWGFSVEVDDGNGETATAALIINVIDVVDMEVLSSGDLSNEIAAYPNPTSRFLHFDNLNAGKVLVYDLYGKLVSSFEIKAGLPLDLTGLTQGRYIGLIHQKGKSVSRFKIIKTN